MQISLRRLALRAGLVSLVLVTAGCGGSSPGNSSALSRAHGKPNLENLLAQPVASPSVCPSNRNGTSSGRASPWVGTVDVSVYLKNSDSARAITAMGARLRHDPLVAKVYFESRHEAYQEFERLYTCSASVKPGSLPASYRLVLRSGVTIGQRNALVARLQRSAPVTLVACDPSAPCVDVVRSVDPSITAQPAPTRPHRRQHR